MSTLSVARSSLTDPSMILFILNPVIINKTYQFILQCRIADPSSFSDDCPLFPPVSPKLRNVLSITHEFDLCPNFDIPC